MNLYIYRLIECSSDIEVKKILVELEVTMNLVLDMVKNGHGIKVCKWRKEVEGKEVYWMVGGISIID